MIKRIVLLAILFILLSFGIATNALSGFDTVVGEYIRGFSSETVTKVFLSINVLGKIQVLIGLLVIVGGYLLLRHKQKRSAFMLFLALAGTVVLQDILKRLFQRPRPDIDHLVEATGYSFPSGHTMMSTALYWLLGYLVCRYLRSRSKSSWYVTLLTSVIILAIAVGRVYLGVHYPSDVLGSVLAGAFWANLCILVENRTSIYTHGLESRTQAMKQ